MKAIALVPILALAACLSGCATDGGGKRIPARFDCDDGSKLSLVFDHDQDAAVLRLPKGKDAVLASQHPGAGMWYLGAGYELRGAGDTLNFTAPEREKTLCTQTR